MKKSSRDCYMIDDRGQQQHISYSKYKELDKRWGHNQYTSEKIVTRSHGYTTIGDKYKRAGHGNRHQVRWDQRWETSEPIVRVHTYENRLQTQSHWGEVSKEDIADYELIPYPLVGGGWESQTILSNGPRFPQAGKYLRYLNGYLNTDRGGYKKVRIWILVWVNQPPIVTEYQRKYWKGGNKNEFIIMLGLTPDKKVMWSDIMTWSASDGLTIRVRNHIGLDMSAGKNGYSGIIGDADMLRFAKWLGAAVQAEYVKPSFKDDYNYIDVQPSLTAIVISYIIILLVNAGAGVFIVMNAWHDSDGLVNNTRFRKRRPNRRRW